MYIGNADTEIPSLGKHNFVKLLCQQ